MFILVEECGKVCCVVINVCLQGDKETLDKGEEYVHVGKV